MTRVIHLVIERDVVVATLVGARHRGSACECVRTQELVADVTTALRGIRRPRFRHRRRAIVVLESPDVRLKTLDGLPPSLDELALRRVVSQQPSRFFLGHAPAIVHVQTAIHEGKPTAALYDEHVVAAISEACDQSNVTIDCFVPASPLRRDSRHPLALRPERPARHRKLARALAAATLFVGVAALLGAKGLRATYELHRAEAGIAALAPLAPFIDSADAEFRRLRLAESEVAAFRQGRRSMTELLGTLGLVLPESTAIASLRGDSTGVVMSVQAIDVSDVVASLLDDPFFRTVQLQGRVAEETTGGAKIQRATLRIVTRQSAMSRSARR